MKTAKRMLSTVALTLSMISLTSASAEESRAELAKELANPIATLISVPFEGNYDTNIGANDSGSRYHVNIQPVVPISLNDDWNIIVRTILPVMWQEDIFEVAGIGSGSQSGLGNTVQSFFFSPKQPTDDGLIWGVGPVFLLPTATDDLLGGDQWGAGPTGVALKQFGGGWTAGALANHIWSFADHKDAKVSTTYMQPFLAYTTPDAWTYAVNSQSTYDWENKNWAVPVNFILQKVIKVGTQMVAIQGAVRYWAVTDSDATPEGWGARLNLTFLFPK